MLQSCVFFNFLWFLQIFWIFNILRIFQYFKNFSQFSNFSTFLQISKKVDDWRAPSWLNATKSEVIFVIDSLLQWLRLSSAIGSNLIGIYFEISWAMGPNLIATYFEILKNFENSKILKNPKILKNSKKCMTKTFRFF